MDGQEIHNLTVEAPIDSQRSLVETNPSIYSTCRKNLKLGTMDTADVLSLINFVLILFFKYTYIQYL